MVVYLVFYTVVCMVFSRNENSEPGYWTQRQSVEPRPRYAHQLVYDEVMDRHGQVRHSDVEEFQIFSRPRTSQDLIYKPRCH